MMAGLTAEAIDELRQYLFELSSPAYIIANRALDVVEATGRLDHYGLQDIRKGQNVCDHLDCLFGIDPDEAIQIPFFHHENVISHIIALPYKGHVAILIMDVSEAYREQQADLQTRNEAVLLKEKLEQLTGELQVAQQALIEKNRLLQEESRLKAGFIANISEEFKTPISSILGYTHVLKSRLEAGHPDLDKLHAIERGAKYLLSLAENLLDQMRYEFSDIDIHEAPTDINELLQDLSSIFLPPANRKNLKLIIENRVRSGTRLLLDELRLRQVLINLLDNAVKFTETGSVTLGCSYADGRLAFTVEDTGIGIPEDQLQNILKPFIRLDEKSRGAGLGLSIARQLADAMNGTLAITSKRGLGSRFTLQLQARPSLPVESTTITRDFSTDRQEDKVSILIVEDDAEQAELYRELLHAPHVTLHLAAGTGEAVKQAVEGKPDLVLFDFDMQQADSGAVIRQIRKQGYANPILGISNSTSYSDRAEAMNAGFNGFIVKPIGLQNLLGTVNSYLILRSKQNIEQAGAAVLRDKYREQLADRRNELMDYLQRIEQHGLQEHNRRNLVKIVRRISLTAGFYTVGNVADAAGYLHDFLNQENIADNNRRNLMEYLERLISSIEKELEGRTY